MSEKLKKVFIFRHGEANYRQSHTDVINATDLTSQGIDFVSGQSEQVARHLSSLSPDTIGIFSSPVPRTLQTALLIRSALIKHDLPLLSKPDSSDIVIKQELDDQKNFSFRFLGLLAYGGWYIKGNSGYLIDSGKTNPEALPLAQLTFDQVKKNINSLSNPEDELLIEDLNNVEPLINVRDRFCRFLSSAIYNNSLKIGDVLFVVTHQANTDFLVRKVTDGQISGLNPGQYLELGVHEKHTEVQCFGYERDLNCDFASLLASHNIDS